MSEGCRRQLSLSQGTAAHCPGWVDRFHECLHGCLYGWMVVKWDDRLSGGLTDVEMKMLTCRGMWSNITLISCIGKCVSVNRYLHLFKLNNLLTLTECVRYNINMLSCFYIDNDINDNYQVMSMSVENSGVLVSDSLFFLLKYLPVFNLQVCTAWSISQIQSDIIIGRWKKKKKNMVFDLKYKDKQTGHPF